MYCDIMHSLPGRESINSTLLAIGITNTAVARASASMVVGAMTVAPEVARGEFPLAVVIR